MSEWEDSAKHFEESADFYRGIVRKVGEGFGVAARTSDDGSVQDDVLALKVPELVDALRADLAAAQAENARLREALSNVGAHAANARVEDSHAVLHGIILTIQDRIDSALAGAGGEDGSGH